MGTMIGTQESLASLLRRLIEREYDAIEAYVVAVEHVDDPAGRRQLSAFLSVHQRHAQELSRQLRALGVEPPDGPDIKQLVTKGRVFFGALLGDRAIFSAMKSNEDDAHAAYERAAARADLPAHLGAVIETHLADERRHRQWIDSWIAQSSQPYGVR